MEPQRLKTFFNIELSAVNKTHCLRVVLRKHVPLRTTKGDPVRESIFFSFPFMSSLIGTDHAMKSFLHASCTHSFFFLCERRTVQLQAFCELSLIHSEHSAGKFCTNSVLAAHFPIPGQCFLRTATHLKLT